MKKLNQVSDSSNQTDTDTYMKILKNTALVFLIIGGLNWGLVGIFDFNLVSFLFDGFSVIISRIIYSLVGIAAVVSAVAWAIPDDDEEYSYKRNYNA